MATFKTTDLTCGCKTLSNDDVMLRGALQVIVESTHLLTRPMPHAFFEDSFRDWSERLRRFSSHFGSVGSGPVTNPWDCSDGWYGGTDRGNVYYAAAWGLIKDELPAASSLQRLTSLNSSGNMIEMLLGVLWLQANCSSMTKEEFFAYLKSREFGLFEDLYGVLYDRLLGPWRTLVLDQNLREPVETLVVTIAWVTSQSCAAPHFYHFMSNRTFCGTRVLQMFENLRLGLPASMSFDEHIEAVFARIASRRPKL